MKKKLLQFQETCKSIKDNVLTQIQKFLNWKKDRLSIWILKLLILAAIIGAIILLYHILPYLFSLAILLLVLCADCIENAINNIGNRGNKENDIYIQNSFCSSALFSILKICDNSTIFNVVAPQVISDIFPDLTKFANPQQINGNLNFYRYPVKLNDLNRVLNLTVLADTLNMMIARKLQNCEIENIPTAFYENISSIQVLGIHTDMFNATYIDFDIMYIDTPAKYNYILRKNQIEQEHDSYLSAPVDDDF